MYKIKYEIIKKIGVPPIHIPDAVSYLPHFRFSKWQAGGDSVAAG